MKSANSVCEKCGTKIFDGARREVCPACLLEIALDLLDNEDEDAISHGRGYLAWGSCERVAGVLGDFGDYELLEEITTRTTD